MSRLFSYLAPIAVCFCLFASAQAESRVLAQLGADGVRIEDDAGVVSLDFALSQAVPWRVQLLDSPPRLVVEFNELEWAQTPQVNSASVSEVRTEMHAPGWSRLVARLQEPLDVETAEMSTDQAGVAHLSIQLVPVTAASFREVAKDNEPEVEMTAHDYELPVVMIDPGHGGRDPGAAAGGLKEADLMLSIAKRLQSVLEETGQFHARLTRNSDEFVSLDARLMRARQESADIFLSLHADSLGEGAGAASGMTVYTLSRDAGERAAQRSVERHASTEIIDGVDLNGTGDDVAVALAQLVRLDTTPRAQALAGTMIRAFEAAQLEVNSRAHRKGDLAVLKSADVPSLLIELGFLSSDDDLNRLQSEEWQQSACVAIRDALLQWNEEDKLLAEALRK